MYNRQIKNPRLSVVLKIFFLSCLSDIKSNPSERWVASYNSRALILKLKKGITVSLLVVFNSFKLQKDHLVNYLFQGTK